MDPWKNFEDGDYVDINHHFDEAFKGIYRQVVETLAPFGQRWKILRRPLPKPRSSPMASETSFLSVLSISVRERSRI